MSSINRLSFVLSTSENEEEDSSDDSSSSPPDAPPVFFQPGPESVSMPNLRNCKSTESISSSLSYNHSTHNFASVVSTTPPICNLLAQYRESSDPRPKLPSSPPPLLLAPKRITYVQFDRQPSPPPSDDHLVFLSSSDLSMHNATVSQQFQSPTEPTISSIPEGEVVIVSRESNDVDENSVPSTPVSLGPPLLEDDVGSGKESLRRYRKSRQASVTKRMPRRSNNHGPILQALMRDPSVADPIYDQPPLDAPTSSGEHPDHDHDHEPDHDDSMALANISDFVEPDGSPPGTDDDSLPHSADDPHPQPPPLPPKKSATTTTMTPSSSSSSSFQQQPAAAVHHFRSVSDHVLSSPSTIGLVHQSSEDGVSKANNVKKSNSDRGEQRPTTLPRTPEASSSHSAKLCKQGPASTSTPVMFYERGIDADGDDGNDSLPNPKHVQLVFDSLRETSVVLDRVRPPQKSATATAATFASRSPSSFSSTSVNNNDSSKSKTKTLSNRFSLFRQKSDTQMVLTSNVSPKSRELLGSGSSRLSLKIKNIFNPKKPIASSSCTGSPPSTSNELGTVVEDDLLSVASTDTDVFNAKKPLWRSFFTRSFADKRPKSQMITDEQTKADMIRARRVSVIGDAECDLKNYAISKENAAKLEAFLPPRRIASTSTICRSESNLSPKAEERTHYSCRTLPRRGRSVHKDVALMNTTLKLKTRRKIQKKSKAARSQTFKRQTTNSESTAGVVGGGGTRKFEKEKKSTVGSKFGGFLPPFIRRPGKSRPSLSNVDPEFKGAGSRLSHPPSPALVPLSKSTSFESNRSISRAALPDNLAGAIYPTAPQRFHPQHTDSLRSLGLQSSASTDDTYYTPELDKPKWNDLNIWKSDKASWNLANPGLTVSNNVRKRLNMIYELYKTEKEHVQKLIVLQQVYQQGLKAMNLVSESELRTLIPDVLDSLLDFHISILRRIKARMDANAIFETVSDIVLDEFTGGYVQAALNGYTLFVIGQAEAVTLFESLHEKQPRFAKFFAHQDSLAKQWKAEFKTCFQQIALRTMRFRLVLEEIQKTEDKPARDVTQRALEAVKSFIMRVNVALRENDVRVNWDKIKAVLDRKSVGRMLKAPFSAQDLIEPEARTVLAIGNATWVHRNISDNAKAQSSKAPEGTELTIALFDDVVAFFVSKGSSLAFCNVNMFSSVIPLKSLLLRPMPRSSKCMFIISDPQNPDMYSLVFPKKTAMENWISAITNAKKNAPDTIHRISGQPVAPSPTVDNVAQLEEAHDLRVNDWITTLEQLFELQRERESMLTDYMTSRLVFNDEIRDHFTRFPLRLAKKPTVPTIERRETRDLEKVKNLVQFKFRELRDQRRLGLDELVQTAVGCRDRDLESFFDDLTDLGQANVSSSSDDSHRQNRGETSSSGASPYTSDDEGAASTDPAASNREKRQPRRVRTYHGTEDTSQPRESIRRHTTVPKFRKGSRSTSVVEFEDLADAEWRKLNLRQSPKVRKATKKLITESVALRVENNRLKSTIAQQEMTIAALKSRKMPVAETTEKLESLRQKQQDVELKGQQLRKDMDDFEEKQRRIKAAFDEREAALVQRETELETRLRFAQPVSLRSGSCVFQESPVNDPARIALPPSQLLATATSPIMQSLASKTETKKRKG